MSSNDLQQQQRNWLQEAYPALLRLAVAITRHPGIAEEALSTALVSILDQISRGVCNATEKGRFCAWVRLIVRVQARRAIGGGATGVKRYAGDVLIDNAADRLRDENRADVTHTQPAVEKDWIADAYTRSEVL